MTQTIETGIPAASYPRFLGNAAGILASLLALGYLPTARLAGDEGVRAMAAGCGVSLVGSVVGTVPFLLSRSRTAIEAMPVVIGSIALRMAAVIALASLTALTGLFAVKPLLVWVAISHAGLLVADTVYARAEVRGKTGAIPPKGGKWKTDAIKGGGGA